MPIIDTFIEGYWGEPKKGAKWKSAIVFQGPFHDKITEMAFKKFLAGNQDILLICSTYGKTWKNCEHQQALIDEGLLVFIFIKEPSREDCPSFWESNFANQNLQRLTSFAGLQYASSLNIEYCLKIRSDTFLGKKNVIDYFIDEIHKYPPVAAANEEIRGRIIVSGQGTITDPEFSPKFHVRDHWYFGFTEDLLKFFDIRSESQWNEGSGISQFSPEAAMTQLWMKRMKLTESSTAELLAKYFIIEDAWTVEQVRPQKTQFGWYLDISQYQYLGVPYLKLIYEVADPPSRVTTKDQWLSFFNEVVSHSHAERRDPAQE